MVPIEKRIPNLLTFCNLFCGFAGILACIGGDLVLGGWMIIIAAVFDLLDGLAAKLLNAYSRLGAELDSLADIVSFGLLPSVIVYMLLVKTHSSVVSSLFFFDIPVFGLLSFLVLAAAAYRLARFNITESGPNFRGLPTPAAAIFFAAFPLMLQYDVFTVKFNILYLSNLLLDPYFLTFSILVVSWLMISRVRLFSLKLSNFKGPNRKLIIIYLLVSVILFAYLLWASIPLIIILYIIFSYFFKFSPDEIQSAD